MTSLVTLTTDFGTSSGYVAQMKGSFFKTLFNGRQASASTPATYQLVDLAHDIPEHNIRAAAWFAATSCFYFPADTLHVIVIDPGVGTSRQIIYAEMGDQRFLAPNNGLLSFAAKQHPPQSFVLLLQNTQLQKHFMAETSLLQQLPTLCAVTHHALAHPSRTLLAFWPEPQKHQSSVVGEIIHIDHFGNLITNLPDTLASSLHATNQLSCDGTPVHHIVSTYGEEKKGTLVGLAGSQGYLEIAVVEGRADHHLHASIGTPVRIDY